MNMHSLNVLPVRYTAQVMRTQLCMVYVRISNLSIMV
jgi:hypothetical protein